MAVRVHEILSSDRLPSLPAVAMRVIELARAPEVDKAEIRQAVRSDPALAAKILRVVNSSLFGLCREVTSLEQALPLLGTTGLISVVLSFSLLPSSTQRGPLAGQLQRFWRSSLTQAVAASVWAKQAGGGTPAEYFVAGLLQDIGALALLRGASDEYVAVQQEWEQSEEELVEIERERLGLTHVEVTAELLERWGLPASMQKAIVAHHASLDQLQQEAAAPHGSLQAALAAAAAIAEYFYREQKWQAWEKLLQLAERLYHCDVDELHARLGEVAAQVQQTVELFSVDVGHTPDYTEILAAASAELLNVACKAHWDPLTRIPKRSEFQRQLVRQWRRAAESGRPLGVLLLDMDRFQQLCDAFGGPTGDKVLQQVARVLKWHAGQADVVARYGADEFGLLKAQTTEAELSAVAQALRREIARESIECNGRLVEVTASVAAVLCAPGKQGATAPKDLMATAERGLREAKRAGRNQVRFLSFRATPKSEEAPTDSHSVLVHGR